MTTDTKSTITLFDRANSQLQNTTVQHSHHLSCTVSLAMKNLHVMLVKICTSEGDSLSPSIQVKQTTVSLCSRSLFDLQKCSASISKCQWMQFFSTWRNSVTHLCFICTSMSDVIVSDCSSVAICHMATECNGILAGWLNLYCHTTKTHL